MMRVIPETTIEPQLVQSCTALSPPIPAWSSEIMALLIVCQLSAGKREFPGAGGHRISIEPARSRMLLYVSAGIVSDDHRHALRIPDDYRVLII